MFKNYSWHHPLWINHRTQHMLSLVYPQQPGGLGEPLLIMINRQFAVYSDSGTTNSNPMPSSADMVPPTATKILTLTLMKTTSAPLNHRSLTFPPPHFTPFSLVFVSEKSITPFRSHEESGTWNVTNKKKKSKCFVSYLLDEEKHCRLINQTNKHKFPKAWL